MDADKYSSPPSDSKTDTAESAAGQGPPGEGPGPVQGPGGQAEGRGRRIPGRKAGIPRGAPVAQMDDFVKMLQEAYSEALMDASENYRANEDNKNHPGGWRHSLYGS